MLPNIRNFLKTNVFNLTVSFCCRFSLSDLWFMSSPLALLKGLFTGLRTDQTNSLHTEQKVGCLKNVAMNSWFFMKWILACLMAPRLRFMVGASSSLAACLFSATYTEKHTSVIPHHCNRKTEVILHTSQTDSLNDNL